MLRAWTLESDSYGLDASALTLIGHTDAIQDIVSIGDGGQLVTSSDDHTLRYWDMHGALHPPCVGRRELDGRFLPGQLAFLHGDRWLLSVGVDARRDDAQLRSDARIWDLELDTVVTAFDVGALGFAAAVSPSGDWLALGGAIDGGGEPAWRIDVRSADLLGGVGRGEVCSGAVLAAVGSGGHVQQLTVDGSPPEVRVAGQWKVNDEQVSFSQFDVAGERFVLADNRGVVKCFEWAQGRPQFVWGHAGHASPLVRCSPDGEYVAVGQGDGSIVRIGMRKGDRLSQWSETHDGPVQALCWSPSGDRLFSGGKDGQVLIWDPHRGVVLTSLQASSEPGQCGVRRLLLDGAGRRLVAARDDGSYDVFDVRSRGRLAARRRYAEAAQSDAESLVDEILRRSGGDSVALQQNAADLLNRQVSEPVRTAIHGLLLAKMDVE